MSAPSLAPEHWDHLCYWLLAIGYGLLAIGYWQAAEDLFFWLYLPCRSALDTII